MNVRVTGQTQTANAIQYMRQQSAALVRYQNQVSTGLRVAAASDDPGQFAPLAAARAAGQRFAAYAETVSDATATLNVGVAALQDVTGVLTRASQIAQEGANGTSGPEAYAALASEVDGLLDRAVRAGNAQADGKYVFAGTATGTPPFAVAAGGPPAAVAYAGSADRARALVGPGQTADTRYAGSAVFQKAGADVFQALITLRDTLRDPALSDGARGQALTGHLQQVQAARDVILDATSEQAAELANLEAVGTRLADLKLTADERAGDLEGTDYAEAIVKMRQQEMQLDATMAVSARLFQTNLLDYLR